MSSIWFTSDHHFHHKKLIERKIRTDFSSVEEMNEVMVERWNSVVRPGDRVYHLGDISFGKPDKTKETLKRLTGQIYLIQGNHDKAAVHRDCVSRFVWVKDYFYFKVGEQKIALSHYAFRVWRSSHHGSWHLYGHSHGSLPDDPHSRSCDVGVDCWLFHPVSYEQIEERMKSKVYVPVDHHAPHMDDEE